MLFFVAACIVILSQARLCWSQTTLSIPSKTQQQVASGNPPLALFIPQTSTKINVTVAICSLDIPFPSFSVQNGTGPVDPPQDSAGRELVIDGGVATWEGVGPATFYAFAPQGVTGSRFFEVGVNAGDAIFARSTVPPLFGDTTSSQAIIFSAPFADAPFDEPSYPNYTLPQGNLSAPPNIPTPPAQTLLVYPTSNISSLVSRVNASFCAMVEIPGNVAGSGKPLSTSDVLRDADGWRTQWVLEGLTPSTNYTVFVISDEALVSPPLYISTKSSDFACSLVHSLPYCPAVSYSVPLPPPAAPSTTYISSNLPSNISEALLSSLGNFTISLLTFACGRDIYSPLQTCATCQAAYREWLCLVSFPRCAEPNDSLSPPPALVPYNATAGTRSANINALGKPFNELLPCLEICYAVARACPSFLGWQCPVFDVNADSSYGIGYIDSKDEEGSGHPGYAQDSFGNAWCNLP